jgi:hypothetical protein
MNRFPKLLLMGVACGTAVAFMENTAFDWPAPREKDRLLKKYWSIPERQIETSVVLVEARSGDKLSS